MSKALKGERPPCPRCGHTHIIKSGTLMGKQRFLCRNCQYQFTIPKMRAKPGNTRAIALTLYSFGLTFEEISALLNVSRPAVHYWMMSFMDKKIQRPDSAELVTIPLSDLLKILPHANMNSKKPVVIVPVDDSTGEIAGMINIPARTGKDARPEKVDAE